MYCTYFGVPKGTSRDEVTSNSKKIEPIALAVIESHLSEGISQSEILLNNFFLILQQLFESIPGRSESLDNGMHGML